MLKFSSKENRNVVYKAQDNKSYRAEVSSKTYKEVETTLGIIDEIIEKQSQSEKNIAHLIWRVQNEIYERLTTPSDRKKEEKAWEVKESNYHVSEKSQKKIKENEKLERWRENQLELRGVLNQYAKHKIFLLAKGISEKEKETHLKLIDHYKTEYIISIDVKNRIELDKFYGAIKKNKIIKKFYDAFYNSLIELKNKKDTENTLSLKLKIADESKYFKELEEGLEDIVPEDIFDIKEPPKDKGVSLGKPDVLIAKNLGKKVTSMINGDDEKTKQYMKEALSHLKNHFEKYSEMYAEIRKNEFPEGLSIQTEKVLREELEELDDYIRKLDKHTPKELLEFSDFIEEVLNKEIKNKCP